MRINEVAGRVAVQLSGLPADTRRHQLGNIRALNPTLHAIVRRRLEDLAAARPGGPDAKKG